MANIDGINLLGAAYNVRTDTASTDAATINIPAARYIITDVVVHNA